MGTSTTSRTPNPVAAAAIVALLLVGVACGGGAASAGRVTVRGGVFAEVGPGGRVTRCLVIIVTPPST